MRFFFTENNTNLDIDKKTIFEQLTKIISQNPSNYKDLINLKKDIQANNIGEKEYE